MFNANLKMVRLGLVVLSLLLFSHPGQARLPESEFACQVNTEGGKSGLVLVQADDKGLAREAAARAVAWEMGGAKSKTLNVVECILVANERFKDSWFQKFFTDFEM